MCPTLLDPACVVGSVTHKAISAVAGSAMDQMASAIQSGVAWVVSTTADWWVRVASPDLAADPAVSRLQQLILPIAAAVAVLGMIIAAGKMALTRKVNPLVDAGSGLVVVAATSAIGVLLPSMLLKAGDAWSAWALDRATGGQFAQRLTAVLSLTGAAPAVAVVLGIVAIVITAVQALLMLFRQAALIVLAGMLPLAAAGTLAQATRAWFRRVTGWMLALIFYKPAAAAVYATAFTMIGSGGGARTMLMGFAMVLLSLAALPVLMRLFTWTVGAVESSSGGSGFLTTAIGGAIAVGALRGSAGGAGGLPAAEQARQMSAQLGPPGRGSPRTGPQDPGPQGAVMTGQRTGPPAGPVPPADHAGPGTGAERGGPGYHGPGGASGATPARTPGPAAGQTVRGAGTAGRAGSAAGLGGAADTATSAAADVVRPPHEEA